MDRTASMPKSVLRYLLGKGQVLRSVNLSPPSLVFLPNKEADGRDRVKQFID